MAFPVPGIGGLYGALKDFRAWRRRRLHKLTPEERLALREKWKERFREEIWKTEEAELRQDIIIRDVRRFDHYPDGPDIKGISPWFRAALVGQYHGGILVALGVHALVWEESESSWRLCGIDEQRDDAITSYLLGHIRYEDIESVDWNGDEYYNYPHVYCHFSHGRGPYEKLVFSERKSNLERHYFFTDLESLESVKLTSQKYGTAWMWRDK